MLLERSALHDLEIPAFVGTLLSEQSCAAQMQMYFLSHEACIDSSTLQ